MDGRLGTLETRQKCKTCGNTASACPGHFGHIELSEPVIHVSFAKLTHRLLSITCRNCGRILLTEEKIEKYRARYAELKERLNTVPDAFLDEIIRDAKKTQQCPHCSQKQYPIEHGKPTTFHEIVAEGGAVRLTDRKSTRLNSSHTVISYAVFCLKKKKKKIIKKNNNKQSS